MAFPFVESGKIYRVIISGACDGQAVLNVYHYKFELVTGGNIPPDTTGYLTALTAIRDEFRTEVLPLLSSVYVVQNYSLAELIPGAPGPTGIRPIVAGFAQDLAGDILNDSGGKAGAPMPTYVAVTARMKTSIGGVTVRGSKRYGPLVETDTTDGGQGNLLNPPVVTAWQQACDSFLSGTIVAGDVEAEHVIFSQKRAAEGNDADLTTYASTPLTIAVNAEVGSQVSRKRKRLNQQ